MHISQRAALAFVVEGKGEWASYPSLVARIAGATFNVPRAQADGYGDVLSNLHDHLDDLVIPYRPIAIIVTIDLMDVVRDRLCTDCADLKEQILASIEEWKEQRRNIPRFQPLPTAIIPVIQVRKFETWWLADPEGLREVQHFDIAREACAWTNVDQEIDDPYSWLKQRCVRAMDLKSPELAKAILGRLDPQRMKLRSPSFDKFHREVAKWYAHWLEQLVAG